MNEHYANCGIKIVRRDGVMTLQQASDDVYDRGPKTEDGLVGM